MEAGFFSQKSNRVLGSLALLMLILALGSYSLYTMKQTDYMYSGPVTISVTGEGEVMAVPDIGEFSFSVNASGADASEAKGEVTKNTDAILAFLKEQGVEEKDIKTESFNMYPKYKYEQRVCPIGSYCPGEQVADGFEVTQSIKVKVRDLDKAGELISGVSDNGATNISSLQFTIDDTSILKAEAREIAIADAKAKAEVLVKNLGVKIDKMVGFHENEGYVEPYYSYAKGGEMMDVEMAVSNVQLPVGEEATKSIVTITYQVK